MNGDQSEAVLSKLRTVLGEAARVAVPEITADTDPWTDFDLDIGEMAGVEARVEQAFGVLLPDCAMLRFRTVGDMATYLADVLSARPGRGFAPLGAAMAGRAGSA